MEKKIYKKLAWVGGGLSPVDSRSWPNTLLQTPGFDFPRPDLSLMNFPSGFWATILKCPPSHSPRCRRIVCYRELWMTVDCTASIPRMDSRWDAVQEKVLSHHIRTRAEIRDFFRSSTHSFWSFSILDMKLARESANSHYSIWFYRLTSSRLEKSCARIHCLSFRG